MERSKKGASKPGTVRRDTPMPPLDAGAAAQPEGGAAAPAAAAPAAAAAGSGDDGVAASSARASSAASSGSLPSFPSDRSDHVTREVWPRVAKQEAPLETSPTNELTKFKKVLFHSLTRRQLVDTVQHWHCATKVCPRSRDSGGFGPDLLKNGVAVTVRVLECGHYLCQKCYDVYRNRTHEHQTTFECPFELEENSRVYCEKEHSPKEMSWRPPALHVQQYLAALVKPGFWCNPCNEDSAWAHTDCFPQFPPRLTQAHCCMYQVNWEYVTDPESLKAGIGCMYCVEEDEVRDTRPSCCGLEHDWLSWKGLEEKIDVYEKIIVKAGELRLQARSPWHLTMFDTPDLLNFAKEILNCKLCKNSYVKEDSCPMIIDCGHVVCSDCANLIITRTSDKKCPFDGCQKPLSEGARKALDIAWVVGSRKMEDFLKCTECKYNYVKELIKRVDGEEMKKKNVCFYCYTRNQPRNYRC